MQCALALADTNAAPVLLFAAPSVVDFYPKFGFRRFLPQRLSLVVELSPDDTGPLRRLNPGSAADRSLLTRLCASSPGHVGSLSAGSDPSILLWYLCNDLTSGYVADDGTSAAFIMQEEDRLYLQDWIGAPPDDITKSLSSVLSAPIKVVEFGFLPPQAWLPLPLAIEDDHGAFMFWRGDNLSPGPLCFPALMHT
jgi:hypothetical protein